MTAHVTTPTATFSGVRDGDIAQFFSLPYSTATLDSYQDPELLSYPEGTHIDASVADPQRLALTISAPYPVRPGADLPIIVYIHGGRYETGTHTDPRAEGSMSARAGAVHFQLGYRVGLPGFARFSDAQPHHYRGIDDCQVGLEWIQRYGEYFGGDPTNITVVGESAGAAIALWLSRKDHYRGAFRRVLALSPAFPRSSFEQRKHQLRLLLRSPITPETLSQLPPARLRRGYQLFRTRHLFDVALGPAPFEPHEHAGVPVVFGATREEFLTEPFGRALDRAGLGRAARTRLARRFDYPQAATDQWLDHITATDPTHLSGHLIGDAMIRRWVLYGARELEQSWLMEFIRPSETAAHSKELRYLFRGAFNPWLVDFAHSGDPGFAPYRAAGTAPGSTAPGHVEIFNLDSGQHYPAPSDTLAYVLGEATAPR